MGIGAGRSSVSPRKKILLIKKPYALEEASTVWECVFIDKKEESTSLDVPLGTIIHNIEITLGNGGQLVRCYRETDCNIG